jgi:hypothetical protein
MISLSIQPQDTYRDGHVVKIDGLLARIWFAIKEFFAGGWTKRDLAAFREDFYPRIRENITVLSNDLLLPSRLDEALPELQKLMKTAAKIANSSWGRTLEKNRSPEYQAFQNDLKRLCEIAEPALDRWMQADIQHRVPIARWIRGTDAQRRFAASLDLEDVPYRFDEIPAGAVMMTDPHAFLLHSKLSDKKTIWMTVILHIKAFICQFFTGMRFTHAELSMGDGDTFDLDKKKEGFISGEGLIQHRKGKVFYGSFVLPRKDLMLEAHRKRFPDSPVASFDELWSQIEEEARRGAPKIQAGFWDIFKTGLRWKRPEDYDCTQAWQPGDKRYGCSALVSSLYSHFGIDIGEEFSKMDQNVTPVDLFHSRFFTPFYDTQRT